MTPVGYSETMLAVVVPAALYASWNDLRRHRVPNALNASLAASGIAAQVFWFGGAGLSQAGLGMLVGFGMLFGLWLIQGMGAGDVKFMAALGAWLGPQMTLYAVLAGGILGGVLALGLIAAQRNWREAAANLGVLTIKLSSWRTALGSFGSAQSLGRTTGVMPYAIPLSLGTLGVVLGHYSGWWEVL